MRRAAVARIAAVPVVVVPLVAVLAGCSPAVALQPAPAGTSVGCAKVLVRLPDVIDGQAKRGVTVQGTAAWGDPVAAQLRCGVTPPGPTTDTCLTIRGVDWISAPQGGSRYRLTTFGRTPATEVLLDASRVSADDAVAAVSAAVGAAGTASRHCEASGGTK